MVLIINGDLVNPPTSPSAFRTLTLAAKVYCLYDILLEVEKEKDMYYKFLKRYGCMDFIDSIIFIGEEKGIRIDTKPHIQPTLVVDRIDINNLWLVLNYIGFDIKKLL